MTWQTLHSHEGDDLTTPFLPDELCEGLFPVPRRIMLATSHIRSQKSAYVGVWDTNIVAS